MAKREKQLHKLFASPAPKDFTWQELHHSDAGSRL